MSSDQISQLLDQIGQKLGPAGSHVYDLMVRQSILNGLIDLLVILILLVMAIVTVRACNKGLESEGDRLVMSWCIWISFLVAFSIFGSWALCNLVNPEWQAISSLIQQVTGH